MNICIAFLLISLGGWASSADINLNTVAMEIMSKNIDAAEGSETDCREGGNCGVSIPELDEDLGLNTFTKLLNKSNLFSYVSSADSITQFGETDEAFAQFPPQVLSPLIENKTLLIQFIKYHISPDAVLSGELTDDMLIPTQYGQTLRANIYPEKGLTTINGRVIELADRIASNGVVHVMGGVLLPSFGSITDTIALCPAMSILNKAVKRAGLRDALAAPGPMTLFAPTDKALAKIPRWCISSLLCNKCLLKSVLLYHVVPSTQWSIGLTNFGKLKTAEGGNLRTFVLKAKVFVNYAEVIFADGNAVNGPIHAINRLLFPWFGADNYCDAVAAGNASAEDLGLEGCEEEDKTTTCDVNDDVELQAILDSVYAESTKIPIYG